jgi:hypothetical protein
LESQKEVRPEHLFKYLSVDGGSFDFTRQAVVLRRLYYQSPLRFNDPFDCAPRHDASHLTDRDLIQVGFETRLRHGIGEQDALKESIKNLSALKHAVRHPERQHRQTQDLRAVLGRLGVLCLSENGDHPLMWSHYASSHRGICLRFNGRDEFFNQTHGITYSSTRPSVCALGTSKSIEIQNQRLQLALCTKHDVWTYEDEWRDIRYPAQLATFDNRVRTYPPTALDGVLLGAAISDEHKRQVAEWIGESAPHARVWQMRIDDYSYALHAKEVRLQHRQGWCFTDT